MAVIVVRHPETADPRVIAGQSDVALAPHALGAIDAIVESLPPAREIVSSDLSRCRILADAIAAKRGVPCSVDARWREQSFGAWEGKRWDDVDGRDYLEHWTTAAPPGGESIADVRARVASALDGARQECLVHAGDVLVITHAGPIRCALAITHNLRIDDTFAIDIPFGSWRTL